MNSRAILVRLLKYAVTSRRTLLGALSLLILATIADVSGPYLIKIFIDNYVSKNMWPVDALTTLVVFYVGAQLLSAVASYKQAILFNAIALRSVQNMREALFEKVLYRPMAFFDTSTTGSMVSRITNDTESIKELYTNVIGTIVQSSVRIIGILIAMAILDFRLMLIATAFVITVALLMVIYQRYSTPVFAQTRALLSDINARLHESIQGMRVIQLMNQQSRFSADFAKVSREHYLSRKRTLKIDSVLLRPMIDVLYISTLAGLLYVYGSDALTGPVEIGVIYAFVSYLARFVEPVVEMTQRLSLLQQAIVAANRVFQLTDAPVEETSGIADLEIDRGKIEFRNVDFSYKSGQPVIKKFSLEIPAGQFVALVGHTGSGKSTIASLLMRFYEPEGGEVLVDGHSLSGLSAKALHDQVAIVQQDSFIVNGTIRENITLGSPLTDEQVKRAATAARMDTWVDQLPQRYETELKEKGSNLSTGQRQQISLARTLAKQPRILILDEATANVDSHTEYEIQKTILALKGRVTIVMIAHRLSTVKDADRIVVLHRGEIAQMGTHDALIRIEGLYQHLYQLQEFHFAKVMTIA